MDLREYAVAFLLTIVLEVAVALTLGYRKRHEILCVVLVNAFSHPLLCYTIGTIAEIGSTPVGWTGTLLLEAGVVLVEWALLCYALPKRQKSRLFALSLAMNSVSFSAGLLFVI